MRIESRSVESDRFVPVATGKFTDLRCGISGTDGKTHADHGMVGEIVIE